MINLEEMLYLRAKEIMSKWNEDGIYAVSFYVYSNECYEYDDFWNLPIFEISYNTEDDCEGAGPHSEERWNYAYWRQDSTAIIDMDTPTPETKALMEWFREQGVEDPGYESYDDDGPIGFLTLVELVGRVARRFQDEDFLKEKLGYSVPILVHDLEYTGCTRRATAYANPNGEADDFLMPWDDGVDQNDMYTRFLGDIFK